MRKVWTAEEENFIRGNIKAPRKAIAEHLGATVAAVNSKIQKMKKIGQLENTTLTKTEIETAKPKLKNIFDLGQAFDLIDENEKEIKRLKNDLEIKTIEAKEYSDHNKKHLSTIASLQKEIEAIKKGEEGQKKHLQEINTALRYREKVIEDLKAQIKDFNPYHDGISETVPKSCFEKLTELFQKLEVKYFETRLELEDMEAYEEVREIQDENFQQAKELATHRKFLNVIEAITTGGQYDY